MTTDEPPLVQINFEEQIIVSNHHPPPQSPLLQPLSLNNHSAKNHNQINLESFCDQQENSLRSTPSSSPNNNNSNSKNIVSTDTTATDNIIINHQSGVENENLKDFLTQPISSPKLLLPDDRHSIISLSSSTTTDIGFDNCIPDVGFDTINLEGSDSRESQPLLGGRDQIDIAYNNFPGKRMYFVSENFCPFVT